MPIRHSCCSFETKDALALVLTSVLSQLVASCTRAWQPWYGRVWAKRSHHWLFVPGRKHNLGAVLSIQPWWYSFLTLSAFPDLPRGATADTMRTKLAVPYYALLVTALWTTKPKNRSNLLALADTFFNFGCSSCDTWSCRAFVKEANALCRMPSH